MSRSLVRSLAVVGAVTILASSQARAQSTEPALPVLPELRADLIAGAQPALQVGAGLQIPMGVYVRTGIDVAVGSRLGSAPATGSRLDGRVDLLTRFLLDPYRQSAWGISAGGGLSLRAEPGDRVRPLLLVALDVEGRRSAHSIAPALQIGLGGGARIGVVLRRAIAQRR
jgi:hypothetical protein